MIFRVSQLRTIVGLAIGFAALISPAYSQRGGAGGAATPTTGAPSTGPGANTPGRGVPGNNPGNNPNQYPNTTNPNNRFPDQTRPIYLSGKVVLDDGTPPPGPVTIERVCNGNPRAQAYTDSKGRFSFQLGQTQGILQDASVGSGGFGGYEGQPGGTNGNRTGGGLGNIGGGDGSRDLMGCEIRANLPGFRSDSVNLGTRRVFDDPDLGTIILHRMANVEGVSISMVSLMAPKDAKKAFDKGVDQLKKKKDAEAEKDFEKAVEIYPKYSMAWFELGRLKESEKDVEGARKAYAQALAADPKYINPYRQLTGISVNEKNWKDVSDTTSRLIKLDPVDFPDAYFYNAAANYYLKNWDEAEKSAREAQKLDPNNRMPKTSQLLGAILAEKQDYAGAAEQMRKYLTLVPEGQDSDLAKKQLADLEKMVVAK
jgi:tetratricopeptide (TPR) repeat protein